MKSRLVLVLSIALANPLFAQRGATYERVLLPIVIQGELPGALGSRWTTYD